MFEIHAIFQDLLQSDPHSIIYLNKLICKRNLPNVAYVNQLVTLNCLNRNRFQKSMHLISWLSDTEFKCSNYGIYDSYAAPIPMKYLIKSGITM